MRAKFEQFLSRGIGTCYLCHRPWKAPATIRIDEKTIQQLGHDRFLGLIGVDPHVTNYSERAGCFPLCEKCWAGLTPENRMPFYEKLIAKWKAMGSQKEEKDFMGIRNAVISGL